MFELTFEFMLVLMFELDMFEFDAGVDTGVEGGVDIGVDVERFVFTRFVLLAVLFDVAPPQAIPKAAMDNIPVSAIFFIKLIDLLLLKGGNTLVID